MGAAALIGLAAALAPATTFSRETTEDLVRRARRVSCATCEHVEMRRDPRLGVVFTHVRLRLLEDLKGVSPAGTIELKLIGGRDGDLETVVAGMPRFKVGQEAVYLLGGRNREGYPVVLQARRGVLPLRRGPRAQRYLAARVSGIAELRGKLHVSLDSFRGAVRRIVREQKARAK
ncbi:MAG: hypothetical protein ACYTG3_02750 [Planctomycetota bacterium]|jgi:hypothetical protein